MPRAKTRRKKTPRKITPRPSMAGDLNPNRRNRRRKPVETSGPGVELRTVRNASRQRRPDGTLTPSHTTIYKLIDDGLLKKYALGSSTTLVDFKEVLAYEQQSGGTGRTRSAVLNEQPPAEP